MEKVTAYKANNGRLFETEEKCLAYEKKLSQYPKVKEETTKSLTYGDIVMHTKKIKKSPNSDLIKEKYFIVGDKYKFMDEFSQHEHSVMNSIPTKIIPMAWYLAFRHFAEMILNGNELTDNLVKEEIEKINDFNEIKLSYEIIEPNRKWKIDNPKWKSGAVAPHTFTMEKID